MDKFTKKTGTSIENNRFYLIVNEIRNTSNFFAGNCFSSQYDFIVAAYSWIEGFSKISSKNNPDYSKSIIYNGIGGGNSGDTCLDYDIRFDYGLLNTDENRKKAAESYSDTFPNSLTTKVIEMVLTAVFNSLADENQYIYLLKNSTNNKIQNTEKLKKQITEYLIEPLKLIENPYEQLAGILIYAQSGSLPLDVYKIELNKVEEINKKLSETLKKNTVANTELPLCLYECDFWGYFFNNQYLDKEEIDTFKLSISPNEIKLIIHHYATDANHENEPKIRERALTGKIIHNQSSENKCGLVVFDFESKENDFFCTVAFKAISPRNGLHFRKGAMLIQNREKDLPVIQSFIFTGKEIDLSISAKKQYIKGLLKLNSDHIYIEKSKLNEYSDDELLKEYLNNGPKIVNKELIEIDAAFISSLAKDKDKYFSLLNLKSIAFGPSLYILSESNELFHNIAELYDDQNIQGQ